MHLLCDCGAFNDSIIRNNDFLLLRPRLERHLQIKFPSTNPQTPTDHHLVNGTSPKESKVAEFLKNLHADVRQMTINMT